MIDVLRLKKYFSCYFAQNKRKPFHEFVANCYAPIEHLFGCHTFCDEEWCWAKGVSDGIHKMITENVEKNGD